jgi:amino acid adenylation domain-containing protein
VGSHRRKATLRCHVMPPDLAMTAPGEHGRHSRNVAGDDFAPFPLTDMQQAWWVGRDRALELGNVPPQRWIEIEGEIVFDRFTAALNRLIDRHGMLRAVVRRDGEQHILPTVPPYRVGVLDLRDQPREFVRERLAEVRQGISEERFATDRWPLFSVRATRLGEQRYRLHFNFDMLLVDLVSFQIMFRDLAMLYEDRDSELPLLDVSLRDCVLATRALEESESYKRSREYWWSRVPALPPAPELPLDQSIGSVDRPRFGVRTLSLEPDAWAGLRARAAEVGVTPTTAVLTAFAEMLRTWSARSAFSFVMVVFNRPQLHPNVNDLIGDFTSTILLTAEGQDGESFELRAKRFQQQIWERLRHRQVSGVQVLRELNRVHGTPTRAGAPVVFNSILQPPRPGLPSASTLEGPLPEVDRAIIEDEGGPERLRAERRIGALGELVYSAGQAPQILLEARASERAGRLVIVLDTVDELFPDGLVSDMVGALDRFLQRLSTDGESWTAPMPSLVPEPHLAQRRAINARSRVELPREPLHKLVAAQADRNPQSLALIWSSGEMTFGQLHDRAERLAQILRIGHVGPDRPVAVLMERGWEQVVAALGALRAGAPYVPIDPDLPRERFWDLLRHSRAHVALSQARVLAALESRAGLNWIAVDGELPSIARQPGVQPGRAEDPAYVIYTSGSTGLPKGVVISHLAASNTILDINRRFDVRPGDRVLAVSSLSFDLSVYDIFGVLAAGGAVVLLDGAGARDPGHWAELAQRKRVTIWNSVPSLMELLVEYLESHPQVAPLPLRLVMLSGDRIPVGLPSRIRKLFGDAQIVSLGGATEASVWSVCYPIGSVDPAWKRIPYGQPLANQSLHVLDEEFAHRPIWVPGQLYIGGTGVALGYWQDQRTTAASFVTHPLTGERLYRSGDICRYLPDGNLDILGREDFQVKVRGFRIELSEIEATLIRHQDVREAVVIAQDTAASTKSLVAYVVAKQQQRPPSADSLRAFLRSRLPEYMLPASYVSVPAVPRNPNGKIAYSLLPNPQPMTPRTVRDTIPDEYRTAADTVCRLIGSVLGIDDLEPGEVELSDLGACSIDYIRIVNSLEEELGFRPDLEALFDEPTISNLVRSYYAWLSADAGL